MSPWLALADEGQKKGFDWTPVWPVVAVVVTGVFGVLTVLITQRGAKGQAQILAKADLSKWHRGLRRQSYVDCIAAFEQFRDLLEPLARAIPWPAGRTLTPAEIAHIDGLLDRLTDRYEDMFQKCQIVRLEGPEDIATSAQGMLMAAAEFRTAAQDRAAAAKQGQGRPGTASWSQAAAGMYTELESFIQKARAVISVD